MSCQGEAVRLCQGCSMMASLSSSSLPSASPAACRLHAAAASAVDDSGSPVFPLLLQPSSCWSLLHPSSDAAAAALPVLLSVGCPVLDGWLGGGLRSGLLTELVGEAGAAKSQLAFQLLLQVQLPLPPLHQQHSHCSAHYGLDGCGLYLSTEGGGLPVSRLEQLAAGLRRRRPELQTADLLQRLLVMECRSVDELLDAVQRVEDGSSDAQQRRQRGRIRLIVIDSIAALFRLEVAQTADGASSSSTSASSASLSSWRASQLFRLSASLRRLSRLQGVLVVVCNQVSDRMDDGDAAGGASGSSGAGGAAAAAGNSSSSISSSGRSVVPALGLSWSSCINARIGLTRQGGGRGAAGTDNGVQRHMQLVFAPHLPCSRIRFHLDADGVRGEAGSVEDMSGHTPAAAAGSCGERVTVLADISNSSRVPTAAAAAAPAASYSCFPPPPCPPQ